MTIAKKGSAIIVKDGRIATHCRCCEQACGFNDLPYSDPKDEGTWTFTGDWPNVTWTFNANPGDESGRTWFFYGSSTTSNATALATFDEITDWGNPCNWYSVNAGTKPDNVFFRNLTKRASRLPPEDADVFILGTVRTTNIGPRTVRSAYICNGGFEANVTATYPIPGTNHNAVFLLATNGGTIYGGASFFSGSTNSGVVNDGAEFNLFTSNNANGTVNGGAVFAQGFSSESRASNVGVVNDGAEFLAGTINTGTVNGGGTFRNSSINYGTVNGGATFHNVSTNGLFGFNDIGTVNGAATFNDQSCSRRIVNGCYVAHPTDIPTCNTSTQTFTCGCGC